MGIDPLKDIEPSSENDRRINGRGRKRKLATNNGLKKEEDRRNGLKELKGREGKGRETILKWGSTPKEKTHCTHPW